MSDRLCWFLLVFMVWIFLLLRIYGFICSSSKAFFKLKLAFCYTLYLLLILHLGPDFPRIPDIIYQRKRDNAYPWFHVAATFKAMHPWAIRNICRCCPYEFSFMFITLVFKRKKVVKSIARYYFWRFDWSHVYNSVQSQQKSESSWT